MALDKKKRQANQQTQRFIRIKGKDYKAENVKRGISLSEFVSYLQSQGFTSKAKFEIMFE
ncbi:MAG: hypothetical protein LLF28_07810 [Nitrospiraceae bacterium]|nr:hypothetical protein [Nitrospiraceae bacterium]